MDWTEIQIHVPAKDVDLAGSIAHMTVPYGIYIEDYSNLEEEVKEIARIDLIDDELLQKDRDTAIVHVYISPEENPAEAVMFLTERLSAENIKHEIKQGICKNEDWENNWKAHFHPMPIGKRLLIRPVWQDDFKADGRLVLDLEPGAAFGTGTHETTRLCLEAIEENLQEGAKVLDIGCGSGILSIAALMLGGKDATAVDIDSLAVKTAIENAKKNGFLPPRYTSLVGDLTKNIDGKFDLVLANIVADAIIELSNSLGQYMKRDALCILSGIIDNREDEVLKALAQNGLDVIKRYEEKGWLCFVCSLNNK